jgi:hypothetical protein
MGGCAVTNEQARAYASNFYDERGEAKPQRAWTEEDEMLLRPPQTEYQKRIARENARRFGDVRGQAAAEFERDVRSAVDIWLTEGGR